MKILLVHDEPLHLRHLRRADGEGSISRLPPKPAAAVAALVQPLGRIRLDQAKHVRNGCSGVNTQQQMEVILYPTDSERSAVMIAHDAVDVTAEFIPLMIGDQRRLVPGPDDDVVFRVDVGT